MPNVTLLCSPPALTIFSQHQTLSTLSYSRCAHLPYSAIYALRTGSVFPRFIEKKLTYISV